MQEQDKKEILLEFAQICRNLKEMNFFKAREDHGEGRLE